MRKTSHEFLKKLTALAVASVFYFDNPRLRIPIGVQMLGAKERRSLCLIPLLSF